MYARWSGRQANLEKSAILFSKSVCVNRGKYVVDGLVVKQMETNDKYLGFQLLKPSYRIDSFEFLFEKLIKKLTGWNETFISHDGKKVLIQIFLGLIPPYYIWLYISFSRLFSPS